VAKALARLGDEVRLLSLIGSDLAGQQVRAALRADGLPGNHVLEAAHTAQSVILYDHGGQRQIHVDLKDLQERAYPPDVFERALAGCAACALCNINFSRPFLSAARAAGCLVATDVHALADLDDDYNRDFLQAADIVFMSHERLPAAPEAWAEAVLGRYGAEIVVIGLGAEGALLAVRGDGFMGRFPAVQTRPVINTIGAGDALFSAFLHSYARARDPYAALRQARVFASWKIGATGAAEGFLDSAGLEELATTVRDKRG
jgi:ribokinase